MKNYKKTTISTAFWSELELSSDKVKWRGQRILTYKREECKVTPEKNSAWKRLRIELPSHLMTDFHVMHTRRSNLSSNGDSIAAYTTTRVFMLLDNQFSRIEVS